MHNLDAPKEKYNIRYTRHYRLYYKKYLENTHAALIEYLKDTLKKIT